MEICERIEFKYSHIFRKDNHYADKLAYLGLENKIQYEWYDTMSSKIALDVFHNRFQLPMFRVV